MYFPQKIQGIKPDSRVLEIGPGTQPHPRSDVLLEKRFDDPDEHARQCGGDPAANQDARTVFYNEESFPFADGEFDYVICSHVIEHVEDVQGFCSEMFRVAKAGYIEYPLVYYDYVYDIPEHLNVLMMKGEVLFHQLKTKVLTPELRPARDLWYRALAAGYTSTVTELAPYIMQGFEWSKPFEVRQASSLDDLFFDHVTIAARPSDPQSSISRVARKLKAMLS